MMSGRSRLTENERLGHSTSKVLPYWEPALELKGYPFRIWLQDLDVRAAGTELQQEHQAPAVAQATGRGRDEVINHTLDQSPTAHKNSGDQQRGILSTSCPP